MQELNRRRSLQSNLRDCTQPLEKDDEHNGRIRKRKKKKNKINKCQKIKGACQCLGILHVGRKNTSNWWFEGLSLNVIPFLWSLSKETRKHMKELDANLWPVIARYFGVEQWYFWNNALIHRLTKTEKWKRRNDTFTLVSAEFSRVIWKHDQSLE